MLEVRECEEVVGREKGGAQAGREELKSGRGGGWRKCARAEKKEEEFVRRYLCLNIPDWKLAHGLNRRSQRRDYRECRLRGPPY